MRITAKVIEDSVWDGQRLTTMELEYPRFIHAEFMTHRVFSRNASSSRAIPVAKLVDMALQDPAFFVEVGRNQAGMQAKELVPEAIRSTFEEEWNELARIASQYALTWAQRYGIHKQVVNRVMEPWHHIKVVVTATEWDNFFLLRDHPDAQPEIRALAIRMKEAMNASTPIARRWHLPYVKHEERLPLATVLSDDLFKLSTARCARVSYMKHDNTKPSKEDDISLHDQLVGSVPRHASPSEHCAVADEDLASRIGTANFRAPWVQYRSFLENDIKPSDGLFS